MLSKDKLDRINFLAKKSKSQGLTDLEKKEQQELRQQYLKVFRANFKKQMECIEFKD